MATIAELLGAKAAEIKALDLGPDKCVQAMHYVATGLKGSPYTKDASGRLRHNGRYAAKPVGNLGADVSLKLLDEARLLRAIFGDNR